MPQNKMKMLDLLALIPAEYFDKIAEETNVDLQIKYTLPETTAAGVKSETFN